MENKGKKFIIYTDGSCIKSSVGKNVGGSAWIVLRNNKIIDKMSLCNTEPKVTSNRCELLAIIMPVINLSGVKKNDIIEVHTDSQYCITVLSDMNKIFPKNMDLIKKYRKNIITGKKHVVFIWVKGHNKDENNEMCDQMAKGAAKFTYECHMQCRKDNIASRH